MIKNRAAIVALLTGFNLLNYLDRYLIAAISPKIQAELHLTDAQIGEVGSAFLWGYTLSSPFLGRLGDKLPRKYLIAAGVAAWCAATAASGLVRTFVAMLCVRILVGLGEASYASLSPTIIDDIIPAEKKSRVLSIFFAAIPVGSALGFVVGGIIDKLWGWRMAFFVGGAPGILLAILCLFIEEPERGERAEVPPIKDAVLALWRSKRYVWAAAGFIAQTFALGGFAHWAPQYVVRKHGADLAQANMVLGGILVVTGFLGSFIGGQLADRLPGEDRLKVAMKICAYATVAATPFAFGAIFAPGTKLFFALLGVAELFIFLSTAPVNTLFLGSVPPAVRAMAMAASILLGHLLGDIISLPLVGVISDNTKNLQLGMVILPAALLVNAVFWLIGIRAPRPPEEPLPQGS